MTINERVKILRKELKLNQADFAKKICLTESAVCNYENNRRTLSEQTIKLICKEFDVNENWLRTGEGEMFKIDRETEIAKLTKQLLKEEETSFKNRLVSVLANLKEQEWETLAKIAEKSAKK